MGKSGRLALGAIAFTLVVDFGIAWIVAQWDRPATLDVIIIMFLAIEAATLAIVVKGGLIAWAWFLIIGRKHSADQIARSYAAAKMPFPRPHEQTLPQYLQRICEAEGEDHQRIHAARELGTYEGLSSQGIMAAVRIAMLGETVVDRMRIYIR